MMRVATGRAVSLSLWLVFVCGLVPKYDATKATADDAVGNTRIPTNGPQRTDATRPLARPLPPMKTATHATTYNPDACGSSWISYVEDDISKVAPWFSRNAEISTWHASHTSAEMTITVTETATKVLWKQLPTQCDQFPRVISIGETVEFSAYPDIHWAPVSEANSPPLPTSLPNPGYKPSAPYPACEIRSNDCQAQWNRFQVYFRNGSRGLRSIAPPSMLDIDRWLAQRHYAANRNFFGGCPQAVRICAEYMGDAFTANLTALRSEFAFAEAQASADGRDYINPPKCFVRGERFVLIHFPPLDITTRDLCAQNTSNVNNETTGSHPQYDSTLLKRNGNVRMIAITDKIVFPAKTRFSYDRVEEGEFWYGFGAEYAPYTVTISASTMTNPDKWTFTSPNAYLAFDKIFATADCSHPGKIFENGILTLAPEEVKTMARDCGSFACWAEGPTLSTPVMVDFADFHGPPPASAYFNLAQGPMGREVVWPRECKWSSTICEELFFPQITLPDRFKTMDPAWATCVSAFWGDYIWDPPLALDPTPVLRPASITMKAKQSPDQTNPAAPGMSISSPDADPTSSPMPQPGIDSRPQPGLLPSGFRPLESPPLKFQPDISSVALIEVGTATITASISPDESVVKIGSHTLHLGDPPLVTAGATFSFGPNGRLEVMQSHPVTPARIFQSGTTVNSGYKTGASSSVAGPAGLPYKTARPEIGASEGVDETTIMLGTSIEGPKTEIFTLGHRRKKNDAVSGASSAIGPYFSMIVTVLVVSFRVQY